MEPCPSPGAPPPPPRGGGGGSAVPDRYFARPAENLARDLLGGTVRSDVGGVATEGRIVETEAYVGLDDPASHAHRSIGRTRRNEPMFGPAGTAYVYFIYGMHWCFNVVAAEEGDPQAVLIRALDPSLGHTAMRRRRGRAHDLCSGPARLCQALGIDGDLNGHDLSEAPLIVRPPDAAIEPGRIEVTGRIGIRKARDWPLRFLLRGNVHISKGPHLLPAHQ
ncbi:MAG: DNA-3-methyladenine glycosylase [Gemmatimonadota bacterium]